MSGGLDQNNEGALFVSGRNSSKNHLTKPRDKNVKKLNPKNLQHCRTSDILSGKINQRIARELENLKDSVKIQIQFRGLMIAH